MKTKILLSLFVVVLLAACSKDKFNTAPTLTFKSAGNKTIAPGGSLQVVFEITDKEGDISNTLFYKKIRTNRNPVRPQDDLGRDSLTYPIPAAPNTRSISMELNLTYPLLQSTLRREPDSLTLQFWIIDKEKNKSEVYNLERVVVIK